MKRKGSETNTYTPSGAPTAGRHRRRPFRLLAVGMAALAACCMLAASAVAATYSQTQTMPVPPASSFAASTGGDGWAVALSQDKVFNVFHHTTPLTVAC